MSRPTSAKGVPGSGVEHSGTVELAGDRGLLTGPGFLICHGHRSFLGPVDTSTRPAHVQRGSAGSLRRPPLLAELAVQAGAVTSTTGDHVSMPTKPTADGPTEDDEARPVAGGQPGQWIVWRQDDNGNRFEVARRESRAEAEDLAATMEARGHKQMYWVAAAAE